MLRRGAPYRIRLCIFISHPSGVVFHARLLDNQDGANTERYARLRKALGETFPTPSLLALTPSQLWRRRAWKIGPGGSDIHRRLRYFALWTRPYLISQQPGLLRVAVCKPGNMWCQGGSHAIPNFRFLLFDLKTGSVFLCSPILQNMTGIKDDVRIRRPKVI